MYKDTNDYVILLKELIADIDILIFNINEAEKMLNNKEEEC